MHPLALEIPIHQTTLRPVQLGDIPALLDCWPERAVPSVERLVKRAEQLTNQGYGLGLVALDGDAVIGYGQFTHWPRYAEISDVVVHEGWRGRGIGTALIQQLCLTAADQQASCLEIGAEQANRRALALYRRLGFGEERTVVLVLDGRPVTITYLRLRLGNRQKTGNITGDFRLP